jgi:excisionase family DNA binding protein
MTKLITIPKFAELTGLPYRLCLHLVGTGQIPSVPVGRRCRIDVRWLDQWLASGGYHPERSRCGSFAAGRELVQSKAADTTE